MPVIISHNGKALMQLRNAHSIQKIRSLIELESGMSVIEKTIIVNIKDNIVNNPFSIFIAADTPIEINLLEGEKQVFSKQYLAATLFDFNTPQMIQVVQFPGGVARKYAQKKPVIEGEFKISGHPEKHKRFDITDVSEKDFPYLSLSDLQINAAENDKTAVLKITMAASLYEDHISHHRYSREYEEGGFYIGQVYREKELENAFILTIENVVAARYIGASADRLILSSESFAEVKNLLRQPEHLNKKLLGWYHTHLFPSGNEVMGLSSIDLYAHFTTFHFEWQVAGLINIENDNSNTLRFYAKKRGLHEMEAIPYWKI
jgi:hypothetical protein